MKINSTLSILAVAALASSAHAATPSSFTAMAHGGPATKQAVDAGPSLKTLPTYFLDEGVFETAAPGLTVEDFSDANVAPGEVLGCGNPVLDGNPCFGPDGLADGLVIATDNGEVVALGAGLIGSTTPTIAADLFASSTIFEFTRPDIYAVGISLGINDLPESLEITVEGFDGNPLDVTSAPVGPAISFWGIVSYAPIGRITLKSLNRAGEIVEKIQFGATDVVVTLEDFEIGRKDSSWTHAGVGNANQGSSFVIEDEGNHELALTSDGATAYLGADNVGFVYKEVIGDFRLEADLDTSTMTTGKAWRKAGLMVRASTEDYDIRLLAMHAPVQGRLQFVAREVFGGPGNVKVALETPAPSSVRLAIQRVDQVLSVQYSLDRGASWITPSTGLGGSIEIPALPPKLYIGMATVSNNISVTSTALFDNVLIARKAAP